MANPLPRSQCFSVAMQSLLFLCHAMLFHRLTVAIRCLANARPVLAVAPLGSAIPLRNPSALCRRAALLRLCTSLLGFAAAPLGYALPLQSCSLPCRLRSKAHPSYALAHPSYAFAARVVAGQCNANAVPLRPLLFYAMPLLLLAHNAMPLRCGTKLIHCDTPRSYTLATPLRAFPLRISSVQSKASAKQYLAPAQPYLAAAQLRRTV